MGAEHPRVLGGLNDIFKKNPSLLLSAHFFNTQPHNGLAFVNGIRKLNLAFNGTLNGNAVTEVQPARQNRRFTFGAPSTHALRREQISIALLPSRTLHDGWYTPYLRIATALHARLGAVTV